MIALLITFIIITILVCGLAVLFKSRNRLKLFTIILNSIALLPAMLLYSFVLFIIFTVMIPDVNKCKGDLILDIIAIFIITIYACMPVIGLILSIRAKKVSVIGIVFGYISLILTVIVFGFVWKGVVTNGNFWV